MEEYATRGQMSSFKFAISLSIPLTQTLSFLSKNPRKTLIPFSFPLKSMASSWTCSRCTFINTDSLKPNCQICSSSQSPPPFSSSSNQEKWSCKACTFLNAYKVSSCEICGTRNTSSSSKLSLYDDELDVGSSDVGNVFLPLLQKCTNAKRKIRDDDPIEIPDDSVDLGVSRRLKSCNKKVVDSDETQQKEDLKTLKILSYNVWFAEDIELLIRMRAIGEIIQLHSPDIICLQELLISMQFFKDPIGGNRIDAHFHLIRRSQGHTFACSKLPVKSFTCKQFSYSAMGRELCITEISLQDKTPLVIATSHLESPCPGPPKWDQMYSKERVKQAQESVDFLKSNLNVIFCGDMNWDDKLDGAFPLPDGWIDAWTELNPGEIGWTYDTKSNLMLTGNRKLQKRLDRFLICLRDCVAESVKMVGTEPIPEVTYLKQKKGGKELELPVLPSDHFGLLLTINVK